MSFILSTVALAHWTLGILRAFLAIHSRHTITAIIVAMCQKISVILAFLLPLKVILLAGNPVVPRYFAFFVDEHTRNYWIIFLAAGTVVFYATSLLLNNLLSSLSRKMVGDILVTGKIYHQRGDQLKHAAAQFQRIISATGSFVFAILGTIVIVFLDPRLSAIFIGLIAFQYALTAAMYTSTMERLIGVSSFITQHRSGYVSLLSSVNFIICFLFILMPFVFGDGGSIIVALVTFLLLRQVFSGLGKAINDYINVYVQRSEIRYLAPADTSKKDPLNSRANKNLQYALSRALRTSEVLKCLQSVNPEVKAARVDWEDPRTKGMLQFSVIAEGADQKPRFRGTLSVFTLKTRHEMENELLLRRSTGAAFPGLPPLVGTLDLKGHEASLHRFSIDAQIDESDWQRIDSQLLAAAWAVTPHEEIVTAYFSTNPPFENGLNEELVQKLSLGVNSTEDAKSLAAFRKRLAAIRAEIAQVPLYVHHTFRDKNAVALDEFGNPLFRRPGAWTIRPIGFYLPRIMNPKELEASLGAIRDERADFESRTQERVMLVNLSAEILHATANDNLQAAISLLSKIQMPRVPSQNDTGALPVA